MSTEVVVSVERARGCGFRKPAKGGVGVYLVGPSTGAPCGRLPFELPECPVCGGGVHPARGWQWIEPRRLFGVPEEFCAADVLRLNGPRLTIADCRACPMGLGTPEGRHGLVWVGEGHYPTPEQFLEESRRMGVSRKIKAVPKGFELGKTVVYLAHRKAVPYVDEAEDLKRGGDVVGPTGWKAGVFSVFRPTGIDLVIDDERNVPERALKLAEQHGARIVKVVPDTGGEKVAAGFESEGATVRDLENEVDDPYGHEGPGGIPTLAGIV